MNFFFSLRIRINVVTFVDISEKSRSVDVYNIWPFEYWTRSYQCRIVYVHYPQIGFDASPKCLLVDTQLTRNINMWTKSVSQMEAERLAINDKPIFHMWLFCRTFFSATAFSRAFVPLFASAVLFFSRRLFRHVLHAPRVTRTRFQRLYINNFIKSYVTGVVTSRPRVKAHIDFGAKHVSRMGNWPFACARSVFQEGNMGFFFNGSFFSERKTARSTENAFAFGPGVFMRFLFMYSDFCLRLNLLFILAYLRCM